MAKLDRAEAAGFSAICLTVDSVRFGSREADWRNNFNGLPPGMTLANYPTEVGKKNNMWLLELWRGTVNSEFRTEA